MFCLSTLFIYFLYCLMFVLQKCFIRVFFCVIMFLQYSRRMTLNFSARPNRGLKIEKSIRAFLKQNQFVERFLHTWLFNQPTQKVWVSSLLWSLCEGSASYCASIERLELYRVRRIKDTVHRKIKMCHHLLTLKPVCNSIQKNTKDIWNSNTNVVACTVKVNRVQTNICFTE